MVNKNILSYYLFMINTLDTTVYSKIKYIVFIKVNIFRISLNVIKENFNDTHF